MSRTQFYYHEKGNHSETWYYLTRDARGHGIVEREFSGGLGSDDMEVGAPTRMSVSEFLASGSGTAQDNLLRLIGTLAG
jgi:hypothetical protein